MQSQKQQLDASENLHSNVKIPFLPGTTFTNPLKTDFSKAQTLGYKDGIPTAKMDYPSIGRECQRSFQNRFTQEELDVPRSFTSSWTRKNLEFGTVGAPDMTARGVSQVTANGAAPPTTETVPSFIAFDKLVLCFHAYFKESVNESRVEVFRVRLVDIYYYLEDDTISINEHVQNNSGIVQGTFLKRHRVPRDERDPNSGLISLEDLDVGANVRIYGRVYHIYDANGSTREYLMNQYGREMSPAEPIPEDAHTKDRERIESHIRVTVRNPDTTLKRFLSHDRKVLRFNGMWVDDTMFGEKRFFAINHFLSDNTTEVLELRRPNSGHEKFPSFVRRQRIPKDGQAHLHFSDTSFEPLKETDFMVGKEVTIYGRTFLLYDCDDFTKNYYMKTFGIPEEDFTPIPVVAEAQEEASKTTREIPPHLGFGAELDSLATCFHIQPRPWPRDYVKLLVLDKDSLHYLARIETASPSDSERRFVITFFLSDDTISIYEPSQRNIGVVQGKFMERAKVYKPDSNVYINSQDFFLGAVLEIRTRRFVLLDCDKKTMQLSRILGCPAPDDVRLEAEYRLRIGGLYERQKVNKAIEAMGGGKVTLATFKKYMDAYGVGPTESELGALAEINESKQEGAASSSSSSSSSSSAPQEGGEGEDVEIDLKEFSKSLSDLSKIQDGSLFKGEDIIHARPIEVNNMREAVATRAYNEPMTNTQKARLGVTISGRGGVGVRDATVATGTVSLQPTDVAEANMTTRAFGVKNRQPKPSPTDIKPIPHSSGVMTGTIKRSLLEGETEREFRARLKREKTLIQTIVERINLKHASLTDAFNAFTLKQTPRLTRDRFRQQISSYGNLSKASEMELIENHFFGDADEIEYIDFVRAMHPEETPLTYDAAIAPARS